MSIDVETIGVEFKTDGLKAGQRELDKTTQAANRTADAADKVSGASGRAERATSSWAAAAKSFVGGIAIAAVARQYIDLSDAYTSMSSKLKLVSKDSADFAQTQERLFELAKESRTSVKATVDLYSTLARSTKELGLTQGQLAAITGTFNKAIAVSGGSSQAAEAAITQFNQAMASGVLRGEEFNSMSEQAPRIMDILAKQLGKTRGELRQLAEDGRLTSSIVLPALLNGTAEINAEFSRLTPTVSQAGSQLSDSAMKMVGAIDGFTGTSSSIATWALAASSGIDSVSKSMRELQREGVTLRSTMIDLTGVLDGIPIFKLANIFLQSRKASEDAARTAGNSQSQIRAIDNAIDAQAKLQQALTEGDNKAAREGLLKKYATDAQRLAAELEAAKKAFGGMIPPELEAQIRAKFTKPVKDAETAQQRLEKAREAFLAQHAPYQTALEMAGIEQDHWNKTMAAGQVEIDKLLKAEQARTAALQGDVEKQRQANQMIGLSRTEIAQLEAARLMDTAAILEQTAALNEQMGDMSGLNAEYRKQAAQLREMAGLKVAGAFGEEMDAQRKAETTEWARHWDQVSQGMVDSLMQGGKSVAEYLKGLFRTLVLQPILKMGVQSALGAIGLGGPGGGGGAMGTLSSLNSLYNTGSTVASWLGLGAAATGTGLAATAGTGMALASGATGLGLTAGAGTGLSLAGAGTGLGLTASAGTGTALAAGAGSAGASAGLAAIPGWGWAAAAVLAILGSGLGKTPGEQHTGGFYSSSGRTGMDAALGITGGNDAYARDLIKRANPEIESMVGNVVDSVIKSTTAQAKALGMDIAVGIDAGFAANTNGQGANKNAFGYFDVTINGETVAEYVNRTLGEDVTQATAQWTSDMTDAVAEWVLGGKELIKSGETAGQALARLSTNLTSVNSTFDVLGYKMFDASVGGAALASSLVDAFGSLERFTELTGQFYQSYYSDSERFATSQRLLRDQFAALNMTMPESTASFRAMVESAQSAGDSGLLASLLELGPAFYAVANAVEDVFNSISATTAQSVRDIEMSILGDQEKYLYLDREIEGLITKLSAATLPAEIEKLFGQINSSTMAAYNLLGADQQKGVAADFIDRLYEAEAIAQSRLSVTGNQATTDDAQAQAVQDSKAAAAENRAAATEMRTAATLSRQAAETMLEAAQTPKTIQLLNQYGQPIGSEVVFA